MPFPLVGRRRYGPVRIPRVHEYISLPRSGADGSRTKDVHICIHCGKISWVGRANLLEIHLGEGFYLCANGRRISIVELVHWVWGNGLNLMFRGPEGVESVYWL